MYTRMGEEGGFRRMHNLDLNSLSFSAVLGGCKSRGFSYAWARVCGRVWGFAVWVMLMFCVVGGGCGSWGGRGGGLGGWDWIGGLEVEGFGAGWGRGRFDGMRMSGVGSCVEEGGRIVRGWKGDWDGAR